MAISRFVWLLLFLWAGYQALMCTVSYQLEWDDNSDVRMRYVEHKLLLLKAGERGNGLVRWWTEADRGGDVYRELREVLPDSIPEDGKWLLEVARDVIELRIARAEGRDPPEMSSLEDYNLRYVERRIDYPLYVIEASLHVQVSPELKRYLLESEDEILRRSFISALPEFVLMVLGLLFLPSVIRKGDSRKVESEDGEKSSPWIVLSIFAGASLLAVGVELVAVFAWSFFPYFDGDLGWVGILVESASGFVDGTLLFQAGSPSFESTSAFQVTSLERDDCGFRGGFVAELSSVLFAEVHWGGSERLL